MLHKITQMTNDNSIKFNTWLDITNKIKILENQLEPLQEQQKAICPNIINKTRIILYYK
jgi:hypothetical protein